MDEQPQPSTEGKMSGEERAHALYQETLDKLNARIEEFRGDKAKALEMVRDDYMQAAGRLDSTDEIIRKMKALQEAVDAINEDDIDTMSLVNKLKKAIEKA